MDNPIREILTKLGTECFQTGDNWKCSCPFPDHDDSTASFHFGKLHRGPWFNCFGCGRHGSARKLVALLGVDGNGLDLGTGGEAGPAPAPYEPDEYDLVMERMPVLCRHYLRLARRQGDLKEAVGHVRTIMHRLMTEGYRSAFIGTEQEAYYMDPIRDMEGKLRGLMDGMRNGDAVLQTASR